MGLQDLIVTPLLLFMVYPLAYVLRGYFTNTDTRTYFIPGLTLKIIGAVSLGLVYQFYYEGGDTLNYFHRGSRYIWEAFTDSPLTAIKLIFANGNYSADTYKYASQIIYFTDQPSYFVVRVAGIFDIITFHTYSATAVLFAIFSFSGIWAMYSALYRLFPRLHLQLAIAMFFIPSVFFWGSGILKDTITLGALGWATFAFVQIFFLQRNYLSSILIILISFFMIYEIKIYILLCFIPALMIWYLTWRMKKIRNVVLKALIFPFAAVIIVLSGYYAVKIIGEENKRYNLERLTFTAESTARWLSYVSEREQGSGYTLGDFDFSPPGIIRKAPAAVWVTLFRPYPWEADNPAMWLSALESLLMLFFTLYIVLKAVMQKRLKYLITDPTVIFCLIFSITFAFAVGISTYNFGTLVRYKIPIIPFYVAGLFLILRDIGNTLKTTLKAGMSFGKASASEHPVKRMDKF